MIAGGSSYAEIASALGKGLKPKYISNRWQNRMKEWSNITKPTVQPGRHSSITWTAGDGATIVSMIAGGSSYAETASALGKGLKPKDIINMRHNKLKETSGIIKPPVKGRRSSSITWTVEDDATIARMKVGGSLLSNSALAPSKGHKIDDASNRWRRYLQH